MKKIALLLCLLSLLLAACGDPNAPAPGVDVITVTPTPDPDVVIAKPSDPTTEDPAEETPSETPGEPPEVSDNPVTADALTDEELVQAWALISQWSATAIGAEQLAFTLNTETDSLPMDLEVEMSGDNVSIAVVMPEHRFRLLRTGGMTYMLDDAAGTYAPVDKSFFDTYYAIADKTILLGMSEGGNTLRYASEGLFGEMAYHLHYQNGGSIDAYFNAANGAPMRLESVIDGSVIQLSYSNIRMSGIDSTRLTLPSEYRLVAIGS